MGQHRNDIDQSLEEDRLPDEAGEAAGAAGDVKKEPPAAGGAPVEAAGPRGDGGEAAAEAEPEMREVDRLRQEIERLQESLAEQRDAALRARAELDNLRKRTARDVENAHRYALERFVAELLPVVDSIELGIDAARSAENAGVLEGLDLTRRKFLDTLEKFGVRVLDPQGQKFDPEQHEAISMQEIPGSDPGTVVTVMQKGYELNGRLVRPAMVVVAKEPSGGDGGA